ncbi:universal stress protein [Pseudothioclava nitratireducens]|jgi:nucleotide-binding universal stress UspA family protein|uniref:universal stress protein n=1 Tax=Pseudothioclava nitratireducens TaxID=1928646 RepID=UPI0023DB28A9|nr:universal stress protein [Defluviimonas nitratireducens]MDF1619535.1 universal stress protein [Defluviimonas nitratireducens]
MIKEIKTILYATDLSNTSVHAFRYGLCMAKGLGARLHMLHVIEPMNEEARMTLQLFISDPAQRNAALNRRRETALELLRERQEAFWAQIPGDEQALRESVDEIEVAEGFAAEAILKRAESLPADMILMGSHAHGISHTFLGTVAKRVLRRARIPTLIVPYAED